MVKPVVVVGIDPGFGRCGWGVIEIQGNRNLPHAFGVIETQAKETFPQRLFQLHEELHRVLVKYSPDEAAVEKLFFAKNVKTAIDVGQARGVVILTCAQFGLTVAEYAPTDIKLAVTGYGRADKPQVQSMVGTLLGTKHKPVKDDAADALAVAICHAHARNMRNLTA